MGGAYQDSAPTTRRILVLTWRTQRVPRQAGTGARRDSKNNRKRDGEETFEFVEFAIEEESVRGYERQLQEEYERRAKEKQEPEGVGGLVRRTLQQQVAALKPFLNEGYLKEIGYGDDMASDIEFKDIDYTSVLNSKNAKQKLTANKGVHKVYGSPNPHLPMSEKQCMGCGALMHCVDPSIPGYLPSEKFTAVLQQSEEEVICQRCFFLIHHQKALNVSVSKEEYRNIVSNIRAKKGLVIFMVDILDLPNSVFPELLDDVGENKKILVLGNKIDLLPGDSPGYLKRIKGQLMNYCTNAGINRNGNITDVRLISAKTAYGVEELVSALQSSWKYKGDVYLVGATNAGKSTLFNTLLQSDYSKAKASEIIKEATISPWPGTTLNLLKFPIINPTPYRMFKRQERLKRDSAKAEDDLDEEELKHLKSLKNKSYIVGRVGRTFKVQSTKQEDLMFDADLLSINTDEDDKPLPGHAREKPNFTYNELKDANWLYDTPGIVKENCVLNHLNDKEVKMVLATQAIIPRTFVLQPGMTLFLGALGRIDFLQAEKSAWFSVIASNLLPVHITNTCKADDIYQKHAGKILLGVPTGGEQRMKAFPPFVPVDVTLKGIGPSEAVADLQLSTAGWVAVTAHSGEHLDLRCYTPRGTSLTIRRPPLLPFIVNIKGERIRKSPAYATKKPSCVVKNFK
ncbi:nitric oxide-associated protein 1 [Spea bombifrons]|uniref:nitric oxide-associated protein 1 n=1 Tax=Spea bombifrons TaxID=233779 RepID=UPI0023494C22|nr:nitric oxide-associated protein 1 [Spea bombifrons]